MSTWEPVDLTGVLDGQRQSAPELLCVGEDFALLYRGRLHLLYGEPEAGKGWLALYGCAERIASGERVLYLDFEDTEEGIVERLEAFGVPREDFLDFFVYVRPEEPATNRALRRLVAMGPALVVIDAMTEAMVMEGLNGDSNHDVACFYGRLARPFANTGAAVLVIDHVTKDRETRGRFSIGAQHKLAGVTAGYRIDVKQPFGRDLAGEASVTVTKDRPGFVRKYAVERSRVATMRLESIDEDVTVTLGRVGAGGFRLRPTVLMERTARVIEQGPGIGSKELRARVQGNHEAKALAVRALVEERYVEVVKDGRAHRHYSMRPFSDAASGEGAQGAQTCPDGAPGQGAQVPKVPLKGTWGAGHDGHADDVPANGHGDMTEQEFAALVGGGKVW